MNMMVMKVRVLFLRRLAITTIILVLTLTAAGMFFGFVIIIITGVHIA